MIIRWEISSEDPPNTIYFVNDSKIGTNDIGFDKILKIIRLNKKIKVVIKISHISSLGGHSLINTLPFKDRFDELKNALGTNKLIYEFFKEC